MALITAIPQMPLPDNSATLSFVMPPIAMTGMELSLIHIYNLSNVALTSKNRSTHTDQIHEAMSFGAAVELAVAMPLSWLPLISDYTREAKQPVKATAVSAIVYGLSLIHIFSTT